MDSVKNKIFYFVAIGGVGQSALAKILKTKGYKVFGSDIKESKYTKELETLGVQVNIGQDGSKIAPDQIIVLSSAIKPDNLEYIKAKELNLPIYHRSDILKLISDEYETFIGFSGTHGKTTTSGLCSYILEKINSHPAYASGGIIEGLQVNANAYPDSKIFVAELDESDGTITKYSPDYIVINNLEADHFDFYKKGEDDLVEKFKTFVDSLKPSSKVFLNLDDFNNKKLIPHVKNLVAYSAKDKNADYYASDIICNKDINTFNLYKKGKLLGEVKTLIKGLHNVYNALSVLSVLLEYGFKFEEIVPHFLTFGGMKRRFETVFKNENIHIIDDYAHHPTEIKATLKNASNLKAKRTVVVFQPHRYTRLKALWSEFLTSFEGVDKLFVVDTYSAGDPFDAVYNSENFAKEVQNLNALYIKGTMDEAAKEIFKYLEKGDLVVTVGAGDVTRIGGLIGDCL